MEPTIADSGVEGVLRTVLREANDELLVVDPSAEAVEALVELATETEEALPTIHLLADEGLLKDVMGDFLVASNAADLVDAGTLSIRALDTAVVNSLLITRETVTAVVAAGDRVAALTTDDATFVETAFDTYRTMAERTDEFALRTPAISRVRRRLDEDIGADTRADFDAMLASLETARGHGEGLDEVTVSLLVAAKNEVLLYDISRWGEDVGVASKATYSRTKSRLEEAGLIDTEKVPIDVGRPRLRLVLGDDRLREADAAELASIAQSMLAG